MPRAPTWAPRPRCSDGVWSLCVRIRLRCVSGVLIERTAKVKPYSECHVSAPADQKVKNESRVTSVSHGV